MLFVVTALFGVAVLGVYLVLKFYHKKEDTLHVPLVTINEEINT
jgi:hypothetical protein